MDIASIEKAALMTGLPLWKLQYAIEDGLITYAKVGGKTIVVLDDIINKNNNRFFAPFSMIKRSLRHCGLWDNAWYENWEQEEPPMTDAEYEEWVERKRDLFGIDRTMGDLERAEWRLKGKDY